ncbi:unnamed protein product, partial [Staurois parvus]
PEALIPVAVPPPASKRRCPLFVLFLKAGCPVLCPRMRLSVSSASTCGAVLSVTSVGEFGAREGEKMAGSVKHNLAGEPGGEAQPVCVRTSGAKSWLVVGVFLRRNGPPT